MEVMTSLAVHFPGLLETFALTTSAVIKLACTPSISLSQHLEKVQQSSNM